MGFWFDVDHEQRGKPDGGQLELALPIRRMLDEEGLGPVFGHKRHSESRPGKVRNAGKKQILGL